MSDLAQASLTALSEWIDAGNTHRDPESVTWGRIAKLTEESGEVIAAYIGATGQNPRKGVTHTVEDVIAELLDVAVTALGAVEHLTEHRGDALARLDEKIVAVGKRAGVVTTPARPVRLCSTCGDESAYCDGSRHKDADEYRLRHRDREARVVRGAVGGAPWGLSSMSTASPATTESAGRRSPTATSARASATARGQ